MTQTIRLIYLSLPVFLFPFFLFGQTFTIGDSTGQNASNSYPTPYGDFRESTRAQYLYLASELTAEGAVAGNITNLGFFVSNVAGAGVHENYTVKLLLTTSVTLPNGSWQSGATTVYGPVDYTPTVGLNEYAISTPFYWDGTSNLVVEICHSITNTAGDNATQNAVVQLTTALAFNGSRTRAQNNNNAICGTTATNEQGVRTSRPVLSLTFCYPPTSLTIVGVTSVSANVSWSPPVIGSPAGYDWTYGLSGYVPGVSGTELGNGSTTGTSAVLTGLSGLETYAFWVRSDCGDGYSRWEGPLNFTTEPSCGDPFNDTGGPIFPYDTSENYVKTFCPDIADNALTMNFFLPLSTESADTLKIYNGDDTGFPLMAALAGVYAVPPGPFVATTATGCLTIQFTSNDTTTAADQGWLALLFCNPLPDDVCYEVLELDTANVTSTTADVSWIDMFGAASYHWELVELPYVGPSSVVQSDVAYTGTTVNFTGLEPGTSYQFAVRTNCVNDVSSAWDTIKFVTPINCTGTLIQCDQTYAFTAGKTGLWNVSDCGTATPGKERIFRFVAPHTRSYNLEVTAASGGFVNYFIKAEPGGCSSADWNCIDDFNVPGVSDLPAIPGNKLTAGVLYYILADPQTTSTVAQTFKITACDVPNDTPLDAIEIQLNTACTSNIYSNFDATFDTGEPDPDVDETDGLSGRWLDAADETVWFKFQAPASGTVTIFTNPSGSHIPNDDTQVALYKVGDESDYATFELLVSDEDNGNTYLGFNSVVSYTGLEDGETYYIQVDGWGTSSGAFCIAVIETVERVQEANCDDDFSAVNVNEDKWYNIWTTPDDLDIGPMVAAINPLGLNLDTVRCRAQKYDEIPYSNNGIPYLPLYYYFESSQPFVGNVLLRLFFTDNEFAALKDSANAPSNTIDDLRVSRFKGDIEDCNQLNNDGASVLIGSVNAVPMVGTFYLEFSTDKLGEFGAHFGSAPLPLKLKFFTGKTLDQFNLLEWTTLEEKNVQWHIVERSPDGAHWTEAGRKQGQANSNIPLSYSLEDRQPLAKAYYRLRSVDYDGAASVSSAILLTRRSEQFGIVGAFPSPTADQLTVQFSTVNEEDVAIQVTDFTGRVVVTQPAVAAKGVSETKLSLRYLPAGVYSVTVSGSAGVSEPARVVKQ